MSLITLLVFLASALPALASGPHIYITGGVPGPTENRVGTKHHRLGLGGTSETVIESSGSTGSFNSTTGSQTCNGTTFTNNNPNDNTNACDIATFSIGGQYLQANEWYVLHTDLNTEDGVCTWANSPQLNFSFGAGNQANTLGLDGTLLQADFDGRLIEAITIVNCEPNYYHFSLIGPYLCNDSLSTNANGGFGPGNGFDSSSGCVIGAQADPSILVSSQSPYTYNTLLNLEPPQP